MYINNEAPVCDKSYKQYKYEKAPKRRNLIGEVLPREIFWGILSTLDNDQILNKPVHR